MLTTICTNFLAPCVLLFICNLLMVMKLRSLDFRQKALHNSSRQVSTATHSRNENMTGNATSTGGENDESILKGLCLETFMHTRSPFGDANNNWNLFSKDEEKRNSSTDKNDTRERDALPVTKSTSLLFSTISSAMHESVNIDQDVPGRRASDQSSDLSDDGKEQWSRPSMVVKDKQSASAYNRDSRRLHSLTILLLSASFIYLALNIPFNVFHMFFAGDVNAMVKGCYLKRLIPNSTFLLQYCNHTINFFVYCAAGSQFRQEFMKLYRRNRARWIA